MCIEITATNADFNILRIDAMKYSSALVTGGIPLTKGQQCWRISHVMGSSCIVWQLLRWQQLPRKARKPIMFHIKLTHFRRSVENRSVDGNCRWRDDVIKAKLRQVAGGETALLLWCQSKQCISTDINTDKAIDEFCVKEWYYK